MMKPLSSSVCSNKSMVSLSIAADWRFLHSWAVRGKVKRLVWNPAVKLCTRNMASEEVGCVER